MNYYIIIFCYCIAIAFTPHFSTILQNSTVFSIVDKQRILHVMGFEHPLTSVVKIFKLNRKKSRYNKD